METTALKYKLMKVPFDSATHETDMEDVIAREVMGGWRVITAYGQTYPESLEGYSVQVSATYVLFAK